MTEDNLIILERPYRRNVAFHGELISAIDGTDLSVRIYKTKSGKYVFYERDWIRGEAEVDVFSSLEELVEVVGRRPTVIEAVKKIKPELVTDYVE